MYSILHQIRIQRRSAHHLQHANLHFPLLRSTSPSHRVAIRLSWKGKAIYLKISFQKPRKSTTRWKYEYPIVPAGNLVDETCLQNIWSRLRNLASLTFPRSLIYFRNESRLYLGEISSTKGSLTTCTRWGFTKAYQGAMFSQNGFATPEISISS